MVVVLSDEDSHKSPSQAGPSNRSPSVDDEPPAYDHPVSPIRLEAQETTPLISTSPQLHSKYKATTRFWITAAMAVISFVPIVLLLIAFVALRRPRNDEAYVRVVSLPYLVHPTYVILIDLVAKRDTGRI